MQVEILREYAVDAQLSSEIAGLLECSFPNEFDGRTYFKQLPHFRLIVRQNHKLVGQLGVDHRIIVVGEQYFEIFGIIDLCVHPNSRCRGIGKLLLEQVNLIAKTAEVDFCIAFADDSRLYTRCGYSRTAPSLTTWLGIEERKTIGVIERDMSDILIIKEVSGKKWLVGQIDLLGYLF